MLVAFGHVVVELGVQGWIEVLAVLLALQARVRVGRDDDVRLVPGADLSLHGGWLPRSAGPSGSPAGELLDTVT